MLKICHFHLFIYHFLISIYALVKEAGGSDLNILKSNYKNIKVKEKKVLLFGQIHSFPVVEVSH